MKEIYVKRANRLLVMLFTEWKTHENINRPQKIEWNIMHMFSSSQLAKIYALKYDLDIELCAMIAILHDIAVVEGKIKKDHDKLAKEYVLGAIDRYNNDYRKKLEIITEEEIGIILKAVSVHSDKKTVSENKYVEMLKNVDSTDRYLYGIKTEDEYEVRANVLIEEIKK